MMSATPISSKYFSAIVAIYDTTSFANQFLTSQDTISSSNLLQLTKTKPYKLRSFTKE
jgi:hypothetical protein